MINSFWAKEICTYSFSIGSGKTIAKKIGWELVKKQRSLQKKVRSLQKKERSLQKKERSLLKKERSLQKKEVYKKKIGWEIVKKEKSVGRMEVEDKRKQTKTKD